MKTREQSGGHVPFGCRDFAIVSLLVISGVLALACAGLVG